VGKLSTNAYEWNNYTLKFLDSQGFFPFLFNIAVLFSHISFNCAFINKSRPFSSVFSSFCLGSEEIYALSALSLPHNVNYVVTWQTPLGCSPPFRLIWA